MVSQKGKLYIGTSGWMYKDWGEHFYPKDLPARKHLNYLSQYFNTLEINASFYRLPKKETFENWYKQVPDDFIFAVKFSRYSTHIKRLMDPKQSLFMFLENAAGLGKKLGPILVQLPPSFKPDFPKIEIFFKEAKIVTKALKLRGIKFALEVRHKDWFQKENSEKLQKILKRYKAAWVLAHSGKYEYPSGEPVTADFIYIRFHGPEDMFASPYGKKLLKPWVSKIEKWLKQGLIVYAYFNNDQKGFALQDAKVLQKFLD